MTFNSMGKDEHRALLAEKDIYELSVRLILFLYIFYNSFGFGILFSKVNLLYLSRL